MSLGFDHWDELHVRGPSLYLLVVCETTFDASTDPMGNNRWPVERCRVVTSSPDEFTQVAEDVAFPRDGAIVVDGDGTVQEQMVRVRSPCRDSLAERAPSTTPSGWGPNT